MLSRPLKSSCTVLGNCHSARGTKLFNDIVEFDFRYKAFWVTRGRWQVTTWLHRFPVVNRCRDFGWSLRLHFFHCSYCGWFPKASLRVFHSRGGSISFSSCPYVIKRNIGFNKVRRFITLPGVNFYNDTVISPSQASLGSVLSLANAPLDGYPFGLASANATRVEVRMAACVGIRTGGMAC